jgi:ribulose-phosphate 3-epimerase
MLAPSILNADFGDLKKAIGFIQEGADVIHLDVMDGNFVPNITFGPVVVEGIRSLTGLPLDVHLMIARPADFAGEFIKAGADWVSFHAEVLPDPRELLTMIRESGAQAGVAINPATPASALLDYLEFMDFALVMTVVPGFGGQKMLPGALKKIAELKRAASERGLDLDVEVDGGVNIQNLPEVVEAGADVIVAGSSIFGAPDPRKAAAEMREFMMAIAASD